MKKTFFSTLIVFIVILIGCNKKDDAPISKSSFLTSGSWMLTASAHDNDGDGTYETNDFAGFPACYRDNIWTFRPNGELLFDEGPTKCDPIDPQTDVTLWQLTSNETTLVLDGDAYSIQELNNSTLKFKQTVSGNRSSMVVFTKR